MEPHITSQVISQLVYLQEQQVMLLLKLLKEHLLMFGDLIQQQVLYYQYMKLEF